MGKFNLDDYETVKSRKLRFYTDFPEGSIKVALLSDKYIEEALFMASVYTSYENQEKGLTRGTGYAYEIRDTEKRLDRYGKEYESVNYTSWIENCEESAVGRALDNAGYASNMKCSREEIEKANRMKSDNVQPEQNKNGGSTQVTNHKKEAGNVDHYIVPFGKFKDQAISKENIGQVNNYCKYLETSSDKPPSKNVIKLRDEINKFVEAASIIKPITVEDLPF